MIKIDLENGWVSDNETRHSIDSPEAFSLISKAWLRAGWDAKYVYSFTWLGRPIIQLPEDMVRIQEVIYSVRPDIIIETGVAHGGSLIFYAGLCRLIGKGRVIGIDIDIRSHNRQAIEAHQLSPLVTLVEGDSIDHAAVQQVKKLIVTGDTVLVLLDSKHTKEHVLAELNAYAPLVSKGSYIVAMDGIMEELAGAPRSQPDWTWNNPRAAALEFVEKNPDFIIDEPLPIFNEGTVRQRVTYCPQGFIKRIR